MEFGSKVRAPPCGLWRSGARMTGMEPDLGIEVLYRPSGGITETDRNIDITANTFLLPFNPIHLTDTSDVLAADDF